MQHSKEVASEAGGELAARRLPAGAFEVEVESAARKCGCGLRHLQKAKDKGQRAKGKDPEPEFMLTAPDWKKRQAGDDS